MRNLRNRLVESLLPRSDELKALHGLLESAAERAATVSEMAERLLAQASKIPIPGRVRSPVLLQQLELPGIHLSDFDCAIVGNALRRLGPGLTVLDLRDCGMGIDGVMAFSAGMSRARLTALHVLLLGGNWTEAQLEMAVACTRAVCEGLVLSGASNLETLSLSNGMLPQGALALCEALAALRPQRLAFLDVSDSRFGCGGAQALLSAHARAPLLALERLDLFACHIGPKGGEAIGSLLAVTGGGHSPLAAPPPPLQSLCLADNAMQDRGLVALASALRTNAALAASLTDLDLSSNGLGLDDDSSLRMPCGGENACDEFARALTHHATGVHTGGGVGLRRLNLSQNFLGDAGLTGLIPALRAAAGLTWLDVSCCNLRDRGLRALAKLLREPSGLACLEVLGTYHQRTVSDDAARELMLSLRDGGAPRLMALHAGRLNMRGRGSLSAGEAAVELVERRPSLRYVDLRDNFPLEASLRARLEACRHGRGGGGEGEAEGAPPLRLFLPGDPWEDGAPGWSGAAADADAAAEGGTADGGGGDGDGGDGTGDGGEGYCHNDIFSAMEGWHQAGLASSRTMWCRFSQTVYFYRGEDVGGELNQPAFVIQEPGGELSHAAGEA